MRVKYVGDVVPHLTNQWVDIPDGTPLYAATSWIELNLAGTPNGADELRAEQELEEEETGRASDVDGLDAVRQQLEELQGRLSDPGDSVARTSDAIASTARAMQSSWDISRDLKKLEEQARSQVANNQALSAEAQTFAESAASERKKTLDLIKANQRLVNCSLDTHSKSLNTLRRNLSEAEQEVRFLREQAQKDKAVIAKAGKIIRAWEARES